VDAGAVELELILTGLKQVERDLKRFEAQSQKSAKKAQRGFEKLNKTVAGFGSSVRNVAVALGAGAFFKAAITDALDFDRAVTKLNATLGKGASNPVATAANV
jgi:hypothetical protein